MASTADFFLEDQTDEDFFDKLVDDSYTPTASSSAKELKFDDGSDSDDARAFANLSVVDDVVGDGDVALNEAGLGNDVANEGTSGSVGKEEPSSSIAAEAVQFVNSDANKLRDDDDVVRSEVDDMPLTETAKESNIVDGSGSPGVKEVGWGSFYADSSVNDGRGFGSYSDFFTELDGTAGDLQGQAEVAVATGGNLVANATSVGLDNSAGFEQHQGQVHHDSGSGHDGHDASVNAQESYINSTSNWESVAADNSDVAYLKQSTTSAAAGTAESVSTWNQVSQVSNGYPEDMIFDAQYPGWYYDTIAQEWRSLDSYNQASQTTVTGQAHDPQVQNGHAHTATYHSNSQSSQAEPAINSNSLSSFGGNQQVNNLYSTEPVAEQFKPNAIGAQSFIPQHRNVASVTQNGPLSFSNDVCNRPQSVDDAHQSLQNNQLFSPTAGRSSDGRPPHALVSFGFGGKLIVMKGIGGSSASVLNLAEVISGSASYSSQGEDSLSYFRCLHQQSLPGSLVGGNVGSKELHKWIDERILNYSAEAAVAKLFAFAKKDGVQNGYAPISQCLQHLPPESQMQVTASEVQNLLASGRKMEALQCAQEGHLWRPALVIAAQLGDQFYVDTVKRMALRRLIPGSPLRTLCLLVAGQPAEVCPAGSSSMLDNWEENLGIITANRTTDDELVITHL
ncbi:Sec16 central conserved domain [Arabidopsis suecica]|uniref:Protein transport protein sec16 n=1 Tax=Arabidopsis suecica TaxID=45249 RepID=A0A8T1XN28_ARASU|nr:Sec16 central conserved domain [Arabidopsis suecica]